MKVTMEMLYDKIDEMQDDLKVIPTLKWLCGFSLSFSILNLSLMIRAV